MCAVGVLFGDVGWAGVGEVLVECAAVVQGHVLHAEADAEDGVLGVVECFEEGEFELLAAGVDGVGVWVEGCVEGGGVGVVSAGEDDGVGEGEVVGDL